MAENWQCGGYRQFVNAPAHRALGDSQHLRCFLFITTAFFERFADELVFRVGERCANGDGEDTR